MADTTQNFIANFQVKGMQSLDQAERKISSIDNSIKNLTNTLLGVSFGAFIVGAFQAADAISDLSDATGISIGGIKSFQDAMGASGGKVKNAERAILGFIQAIETANDGSLKTRDAFAKVNVSLSDLKNLSEADLLQKTIKGLSEMEKGSERTATQAILLTKAFRGVDVAKFFDEFEKGKITSQELAGKIQAAADRVAEMERAFRTLQEGALLALEPILKMMGETKLTAETAAKAITFVGVALGLTFGASMVARIIALNTAILGTAAATALVGKSPVVRLIAGLGLSALQAAGALKAYDLALESIDEAQKKAAESAKNGIPEPDTGGKGNANRQQELDSRQKAAIESNKRIAQSNSETNLQIALRTASELEKIDMQAEVDLQKAREEIKRKENLSDIQIIKETAAKEREINEKSTTEFQAKRKELEAQVQQQKVGFAQANLQLLGQEYTEVQKVTDQIAQQPLKYKEIGNEMLKNAALQDAEKKRIEEIIRLRQAEREEFGLMTQSMKGAIEFENKMREMRANALGTNKLNLTILQAEGEERLKLYDLENNVKGALESKLIALGRIDELNKKQIEDATTYNEQLAYRKGIIENEKNDKIELAQLDKDLAESFAVGWEGAYNRYVESSKNAADQAKGYFETFSKGFEDVFYNMAKAGEISFKSLKSGFKDVANSLIADFLRIQARQALLGLFGGSSGGGFLGSLFGGFRATGGPVSAGSAYMVGERGPEMFMPKQAGTIVPNNAMGGSSNITNVSYSIQAVDASSFRSMLARDPEFIHNVAEQGRRQLPIRSRR
jgi:lambda family phage tail tape measure protein